MISRSLTVEYRALAVLFSCRKFSKVTLPSRFSLQCRALRVGDPHADFSPGATCARCELCNLSASCRSCPLPPVRPGEFRQARIASSTRSDPSVRDTPGGALRSAPGVTLQCGRSSLPRRILEDESEVEFDFFNQRKRLRGNLLPTRPGNPTMMSVLIVISGMARRNFESARGTFARIVPLHLLQHRIGTGLHRQM